ncbi:MAG: DUF2934 domain-containing protein [Opitutus sp.]
MNSFHADASKFTHDEIAARAHHIWETRGRPSGYDDEIWLEAERQLLGERRTLATSRGASTGSSSAVEIDQGALAERLDDFGEAGSRSATSADRAT